MKKKLKIRGTDLNDVLVKAGFFPGTFRFLGSCKLNRFYFYFFQPLKINGY